MYDLSLYGFYYFFIKVWTNTVYLGIIFRLEGKFRSDTNILMGPQSPSCFPPRPLSSVSSAHLLTSVPCPAPAQWSEGIGPCASRVPQYVVFLVCFPRTGPFTYLATGAFHNCEVNKHRVVFFSVQWLFKFWRFSWKCAIAKNEFLFFWFKFQFGMMECILFFIHLEELCILVSYDFEIFEEDRLSTDLQVSLQN